MLKHLLLGALLTITAFAAQGAATRYPGYLTINMMNNDITANKPDTIQVTNYEDGTALFELPNFALDLGDGAVPLGDITVANCKYTVADGVTTYTGEVKNMELAGGEIKADVTLNGTINAYGEADMKIAVVWMNIPINVSFVAGPRSGINDITADTDAPVVYYNLQGQRLVDPQAGQIVIVRQGRTATKRVL